MVVVVVAAVAEGAAAAEVSVEAAELEEVREQRVLAPVQVDMVAGQVEDMAAV
jgi:hypothetical protein